jgi:hypothetical protein
MLERKLSDAGKGKEVSTSRGAWQYGVESRITASPDSIAAVNSWNSQALTLLNSVENLSQSGSLNWNYPLYQNFSSIGAVGEVPLLGLKSSQ